MCFKGEGTFFLVNIVMKLKIIVLKGPLLKDEGEWRYSLFYYGKTFKILPNQESVAQVFTNFLCDTQNVFAIWHHDIEILRF